MLFFHFFLKQNSFSTIVLFLLSPNIWLGRSLRHDLYSDFVIRNLVLGMFWVDDNGIIDVDLLRIGVGPAVIRQ